MQRVDNLLNPPPHQGTSAHSTPRRHPGSRMFDDEAGQERAIMASDGTYPPRVWPTLPQDG
eukprot:455918-Alexandrium_andersonii.AAC.1